MRADQIKVSVVVQVVEDEVFGYSHGAFHYYGIFIVNLCVPAEVNVIEPVIATIFLIYDDVFDAVVVQVGKYRNGLGFAIIEGDVGVYPLELEVALVDEQHQFVAAKVAVFVPLFAPTGHVHQVVAVDVGIYECRSVKFSTSIGIGAENVFDRMRHESFPVACILIDRVVLIIISG